MTDKELERVIIKTLRPLIREVPSSEAWRIYPIFYDGLLNKGLIKREVKPEISSSKEAEDKQVHEILEGFKKKLENGSKTGKNGLF